LRETWGDNTLDFFYDESGHPYALTYNGTTYYYVTNHQGDVLHILNSSKQVVASYTYDPYGKVLTATGDLAEINPLRYRGYVYDTETGFYYLQSRYYDPTTCRFINPDSYASTGQGILGHNMFAYCNNNPCCHRDDNGMYVVDTDESPDGTTITIKESRSTTSGTVTIIITIDVPALQPYSVSIEGFQLNISTNAIEISTPDGQSFSFNYDSTGIHADSHDIPLTQGDNSSFGFVATKYGFGVQYDTKIEQIDCAIMIMYMPRAIPKAVGRLSSALRSSMGGLAGGVPSWYGSSRYANLAYQSMYGSDKLFGITFIFR